MNRDGPISSDFTVPMEMTRLLLALSDDKSVDIVAALLRRGDMRFGEIKSMFGLNSSSLSSKLKKLQNGGLVVNFYARGDNFGHSYYKATEISKLLFDSLYRIIYEPDAVEFTRQEIDSGPSDKYYITVTDTQNAFGDEKNHIQEINHTSASSLVSATRPIFSSHHTSAHGSRHTDQQERS